MSLVLCLLPFWAKKSDMAKVVSKMQLIVKIVRSTIYQNDLFVCCGVETSERQTVKKPSEQRPKKFQVQRLKVVQAISLSLPSVLEIHQNEFWLQVRIGLETFRVDDQVQKTVKSKS
jgi:hypothetical protein